MIKINDNFWKIETHEHFVYCYHEGDRKVKNRWIKGTIVDFDAEKELKTRFSKLFNKSGTTTAKVEENTVEAKPQEQNIEKEKLVAAFIEKFGKKPHPASSIGKLKERLGA